MSKVTRLPHTVFERLQKHAMPFVDTPATVIEKLLDYYEKKEGSQRMKNDNDGHFNDHKNNFSVSGGRQKGTEGEIVALSNEKIIKHFEGTLAELFEVILHIICHKDYIKKLRPHIPLNTSYRRHGGKKKSRYLINTEPFHPEGNGMRNPVHYIDSGGHEYYMDSDREYPNGIKQLNKMLLICGLEYREIRTL